MLFKKTIRTALTGAFAWCVLAGTALAQGSSGDVGVPIPIGTVTPAEFAGRIINTVLGLTGVVALVIFVYAGFVWMTASGNSDKVDKAKKSMFWASVGLLGIFTSYAAVRFVLESLGV